MEIAAGERISQDCHEPVSTGIPQMNRDFWPILAIGGAWSNVSST
jgi:hypothetical protein